MLTRPPPLQLQFDNTLGPPVRQQQQQQRQVPQQNSLRAFFGQVYQTNWRNFIIAVTAINALRFFVTASNKFQDASTDDSRHASKLASVSVALGAMYIITALIETFGVLSAWMQRLGLIRVYAHLAFISTLLITCAGAVRGISYFVFADDLVHQCVVLAIRGKLHSRMVFGGNPWTKTILPLRAAHKQCLGTWSDQATSQVLSIFVFSLIPAVAYFFLAYTYYRQAADPNHPASLRAARNRGSYAQVALQSNTPPPKSKPQRDNAPQPSGNIADTLLRLHRQRQQKRASANQSNNRSPLMRTASPYGLTPGLPSFGQGYVDGYGLPSTGDVKYV